VAQFGSALRSGRRGRGFKSRLPDSPGSRQRPLGHALGKTKPLKHRLSGESPKSGAAAAPATGTEAVQKAGFRGLEGARLPDPHLTWGKTPSR
jgi:hypothetical protein